MFKRVALAVAITIAVSCFPAFMRQISNWKSLQSVRQFLPFETVLTYKKSIYRPQAGHKISDFDQRITSDTFALFSGAILGAAFLLQGTPKK